MSWDNPFIGKNSFMGDAPPPKILEKSVEIGQHAKCSFYITDPKSQTEVKGRKNCIMCKNKKILSRV